MRRCLLLVIALLLACQRRRASPPAAPPAEVVAPAPARPGSPTLPDSIPSFTSDPLVSANGALHRTYARDAVRVAVTLARFPMDADQYDGWVRTSVAGFPQASLDLPAGAGNGFYQCDDHAPPSCSLLIQLRGGVHLELRGGPASRQDLDAVARGLPLRALAGDGAAAAP
jgi:hypothetical protein